MQQFKRRYPAAALLAGALATLPTPAQRIERDGLLFDGVPASTAIELARYRAGGAQFVDWLPDGSVLVLADQAGQLQLQRLTAPLSTPQPQAGDVETRTAPLWAHDGRRRVYSGARGSEADLYLVESGSAALPRLIAGGSGTWRAEDWSPDDRTLLAVRDDAAGSQLQRVDLQAGTVQRLGKPARNGARTRITQARFAPGGHAVLYLSDEDSEFARLRRLELDDGTVSDVLPARAQDIELFALSPNGRRLAYAYNSNGSQRLVLRELYGGQERIVTSLPGGSIAHLKFDRGGEQLAMDIESDFAPRDVYLVGFDSGVATRWTQSSAGPAGAVNMRVQTLRFPTWDRSNGRARELLARVYQPATAGPHPVLIWLPGGDRQPRDRFDPLLQYLLAENYVVIMPALRGSGGSGRSFAALDDGELRDDPVRDVGALLVWAGLQPGLDRTRTAILGSGDSAALALTSLLQYCDRLRAAIAIDGRPVVAQPQALCQPVLLLRGLQEPMALRASTEQLMWSLRAAGGQAWLAGPARDGVLASPQQGVEILNAVTQFLRAANARPN